MFPITTERKIFIDKIAKIIETDVLPRVDKLDEKSKIPIISAKTLFDLLNLELVYVSSGATGSIFKCRIQESEDPKRKKKYKRSYVAIKMVRYKNEHEYGPISNKTRPENVDIRVGACLSEYVMGNTCPHFVLPIFRCFTDLNYFVKRLMLERKPNPPEDDPLEEFFIDYEKCKLNKYVSVLIYEWCDNGNLYSFMKKNFERIGVPEYKNLFYQVVYGLQQIQWHNPDFRHNDFKPDNILVQSYDWSSSQRERMKSKDASKKEEPWYFHYKYDDTTGWLLPHNPNLCVQIRIWDFDFASIDGKMENLKTKEEWVKKFGVRQTQNKYYDIHYFFTIFFTFGFFADQLAKGRIPKEVVAFYERIVPKQYRYVPGMENPNLGADDSARLMIDDEYTTPLKILTEDPFFAEFVHISKKKKV